MAALIMLLNSFPAFAQSKVNSLFKSIDENPGIYTLNDGNLLRKSSDKNEIIINNGEYYIRSQDNIYCRAQKLEFSTIDQVEHSDLKKETKEIVLNILNSARTDKFTLLNNKVSVYTPENATLVANSLLNKASAYPVTNEQVRYTAITNEKVIKSGSNAFSNYANEVLNNTAKLAVESTISTIAPFAGAVFTIADLFPNYYNEVRNYTNWTLGVKIAEEKVVQLSWVYIDNSPYLGAQTQFATVKHHSILTKGLSNPVVDSSGFIYYRTPNYQNPESIARKNYTNTWVERIDSYKIKGHTFDSPNP